MVDENIVEISESQNRIVMQLDGLKCAVKELTAPVKCNICGKGYSTLASMKSHRYFLKELN